MPSSGTRKASCGVIDGAVERNLKIMLSKLGFAVGAVEEVVDRTRQSTVKGLMEMADKHWIPCMLFRIPSDLYQDVLVTVFQCKVMVAVI